eukprot:4356983-Alexandrium_andersonii.AAC.1
MRWHGARCAALLLHCSVLRKAELDCAVLRCAAPPVPCCDAPLRAACAVLHGAALCAVGLHGACK